MDAPVELWEGFFPEVSARGASAEASERIARYVADLLRFNRVNNLVSRRDPLAQIRLLVLEALEVHSWLEERGVADDSYMDLGTGGGIPGLVFACLRPDRATVLLERRRGRCDFLRREVRELNLRSVEVLEEDAIDAARGDWARRVALVSLKAVAPPSEALQLARPFLVPGSGRALLFQRPDWRLDDDSWGLEAFWTPTTEPLEGEALAAFLLSGRVSKG